MKNIKKILTLLLVAAMIPVCPVMANEDIAPVSENTEYTADIASAASPVNNSRWTQSIIDSAVSHGKVSFALNSAFRWGMSLDNSQAMYFMALAVHDNPEVTTSSGALVRDRLLEQIDSMLTGGREPSCMGGLGGWIDNAAAQTLALAKHTPEVWNHLTAQQKEKADFVMKALAVAGNYTHNYDANPSCDLSQVTWWVNSWNPNHVEGYVGVMIAAHIYFGGADAVNKILADFSYDTYTKQMKSYGYTNMLTHFQATGKNLLEKGGKDALGGTVVGAKLPFTYKDLNSKAKIEYDPMKLYYSLATRMYQHQVKSKIYDSKNVLRGYIYDGTISPVEGQNGMGYEFYTNDANGLRTSADYVATGLRNNIITRATLQALGLWKGEEAKKANEIMYVGMEDFLYKVNPAHGYVGYSKGTNLGLQNENVSVNTMGYSFFKEIWLSYLKDDTPRAFVFAYYDSADQLINLTINETTTSGALKKTVCAYKNATPSYYKAYTWQGLSNAMPISNYNTGLPY